MRGRGSRIWGDVSRPDRVFPTMPPDDSRWCDWSPLDPPEWIFGRGMPTAEGLRVIGRLHACFRPEDFENGKARYWPSAAGGSIERGLDLLQDWVETVKAGPQCEAYRPFEHALWWLRYGIDMEEEFNWLERDGGGGDSCPVTADDNVQMVARLFDAFSRGDVDSILAALSDDVDWQGPVSEHAGSLPWAGRRHGRAQVADYFRQFAAISEWHPMEDVVFTAAGDRVVVEGRNHNRARATGRSYEHQWVMVFTIRDGQIARFRHYYDSADIIRALD